jgi:CheY-like chemotaxis protein
MQSSPAPQAHVDVPPIVLFVDGHRDRLDVFTSCLEEGGLWVATSTVASEAASAAEDLNPDLVVIDADTAGGAASTLVEAIRQPPPLRTVPVILLGSAVDDPAAVDAVMVKPVEPARLLRCAKDLLARARRARTHSQQVIERGRALIAGSATLTAKRERIDAGVEASARRCPACQGPLDWVERGALGGITYDYYRWCLKAADCTATT